MLLLHNMCSATTGGKTTGISRGPGPAEVNSPVIIKGKLNELHLRASALSGWLNTELVSSAVVCFELN